MFELSWDTTRLQELFMLETKDMGTAHHIGEVLQGDRRENCPKLTSELDKQKGI